MFESILPYIFRQNFLQTVVKFLLIQRVMQISIWYRVCLILSLLPWKIIRHFSQAGDTSPRILQAGTTIVSFSFDVMKEKKQMMCIAYSMQTTVQLIRHFFLCSMSLSLSFSDGYAICLALLFVLPSSPVCAPPASLAFFSHRVGEIKFSARTWLSLWEAWLKQTYAINILRGK